MDDVVVIDLSPEWLHDLRRRIETFAADHLRLRFSKWSVSPVPRGINFLGYRIWPYHKLLRRQSVVAAKRKITRLRARNDIEALRSFLAAWIGHASWADTHNLLVSLQVQRGQSHDHQQSRRP
jgi:RNA-directed DNA polymerase